MLVGKYEFKKIHEVSFTYEDNGRWWVCIYGLFGYKTLGPFWTKVAAEEARLFH